MAAIPAGNSRLDNRVLISTPWNPEPGRHELTARIEFAPGCTLLDREISMAWGSPDLKLSHEDTEYKGNRIGEW